ncbi:MAG: PCP reductase family protein [Actinobacteria bacterium]|nr:PCP reductase family protein [Actinomycetota bacterium]
MKFVCLNCETYMLFEKVEKPAEGSLGVFFGCPSCGSKFSMVTNPGETQMVSSLGVQLGGRSAAAEPFEMTRGTLKDEAKAGAGQMAAYLNDRISAGLPASGHAPAGKPTSSGPAEKPAEASAKAGAGCPFSAMVSQMGLTSSTSAEAHQTGSAFVWTADAREKLEQLPSFVRPMVQSSIESYAKKHNYTTITLQVMDDARNASDGMAWSSDAEKRLENIPDFIRPMARKEIERLARERGATTITGEVMDEAKEKFMKFM